jgi:uncharacterized glyoxalase superfamily metalloenzyme YdcJ
MLVKKTATDQRKQLNQMLTGPSRFDGCSILLVQTSFTILRAPKSIVQIAYVVPWAVQTDENIQEFIF